MHAHYSTTAYSLMDSALPAGPRVVALGLFDGLHIGHRAVITAASVCGARCRQSCSVFTFTPGSVSTKPADGWLCDGAQTLSLLSDMGVDELITADFAALHHLSPADFVTTILHQRLQASVVVCGFNYRFGLGGQGDVHTLTALCAPYGIRVIPVEAVEADGAPVSATRIRAALAAGDMALTNRLLGRSFAIGAPVHHGRGLGHTWGIPTINQPLPAGMAPLRYGVYAAAIQIGEALYTGVTNIGVKPTVGSDRPLAETFVEELDEDVYDREVTVFPVRFLRAEQAFPSVTALQEQIHRDIAAAHALFHGEGAPGAVLFDYDDTLNLRDPCIATAIHRVMAHFYPHLPADEWERRVAEMIALNGRGYHMPMSYDDYANLLVTKWGDAIDPDPEVAWRLIWAEFPAACSRSADALDTLLTLKARGYKLGVITNGAPLAQRRKLDFSGLLPLFDAVLVGGEEGVPKPHPAIFRRAAARLGLRPDRCVMVGDHAKNDLCAAQAVGMKTVFIRLDGQEPAVPGELPPGTPTVTQLRQLTALPILGDLTNAHK